MIRTRLTFWNAVVLSLVLAGLGTALFETIKAIRLANVDADLLQKSKVLGQVYADIKGKGFHGPPPEIKNNSALSDDPKVARHIAFEMKISRPRIFSLQGKDIVETKVRTWDIDGLFDARAGRQSFNSIMVDGIPIRILSVPIFDRSKVVAIAQAATPLDSLEEEIESLRRALLLMLPLAILVTSLTGALLTRHMLGPVRAIARAAEKIESSSLSGRLHVHGQDEFAELARTFNGMLDRLEASFQQLSNVLELQRRFTADASHELKTPLTTIKARVDIAQMSGSLTANTEEHIAAIGHAADSMNKIVQGLLFLARSDEGRMEMQPSKLLIKNCVLKAIDSVCPISDRRIEVNAPTDLAVWADPDLIHRVLVNLLENALRHTPVEKPISIDARELTDAVQICVVDRGEGIPEHDLPRVFDRMYRVDSSRNRDSGGTGLGLSIVKSIAEAHGGSVVIDSHFGEGTSVVVTLPKSSPIRENS